MSEVTSSAKKGNVFNDANEALYELQPELQPGCEFFLDIPWPEWSDAELNAEVWDERVTAKGGVVEEQVAEYFDDGDNAIFPLGTKVLSWKRPHEVFSDAVLTVFDPSNGDFELSVPSNKVELSFLGTFIEQLPILQCYALNYGFAVEHESPTFVPNTQGEPWRPWHHIYALCKAGKDQVHKPMYSSYGKYVLRLFYMGSWRKFVVDDRIPCDADGNCMLPVTQVPGELWPIILAKGILKILRVTPLSDFLLVELPFLTLFTGWIYGKITTVNKTREQIWRRFVVLAPRYELPGEDAPAPSVKDNSKKGSSKAEEKKMEPTTERNCFLLATLEGFSEEENLSKSYKIGVTMMRDQPMVKAGPREKTKKWKRIRWIYWASEKGLWTDELKMRPYRRLQSICFAAELNKLLTPDPSEEITFFDIPPDEPLPSENVDDESLKPEQWSDFAKFDEYLLGLDVFFKPSIFPFKFRISTLKAASDKKPVENSAGAKTAPKTAPPQNFYFFSPGLTTASNDSIWISCESTTGIFFGLSLWVCPKQMNKLPCCFDSGIPEFLKIHHGSLVVERFDWRTTEQGEIIGMSRTMGLSSMYLNLKPGRHILKLWLHTDSPCIMDIYSNAELTVSKGYKTRFMMKNESEEIVNYITDVSNAFLNVVQKFGKPDLPASLRIFYDAIMPGNVRMVGYLQKMDDFIQTFLDCILLILADVISSTDELKIMLGALRSLFVNLNIQCDLPKGGPASIYGTGKKTVKKVTPVIKERTLSEILAYPWSPEEVKGITTIQKAFRGFRVRLLWKCQTPGRKEFKPFTDRLKKICDVVFVPQKREFEVGKLIRKITMVNPGLHDSFRFYKDFPNVVQVDEFTGKVANVEPFAWIPIARFIIACHCDDPVPCAFYFSCNLEQFVIQAFDNDTNEEIFRLANSISPHYYRRNVRGYTIIVFGWNEANQKTVNWRLEMVRMKHFQLIHLCNTLLESSCNPYNMPSIDVFELKNFYVPNHRSKVCRCLIKIQKRTLLTLRLTASYSGVDFVATISLDKRFCMTDSEFVVPDRVIAKGRSTGGTFMLPSVLLEYVEPSPWWGDSSMDTDSTLYILEVFVLNNSWPLTKQEWGVVEPIRVNGESWKDSMMNIQSKRGGSESRKKLTRTSRRSVGEQKTIESPFWMLQVLNDSTDRPGSGEAMVIEEDRSYAESVKAMKISWEEKEPGRRKNGQDQRLNFLSMIFEERKAQMNEGEGIFDEMSKDSEKDEEYIGDFKTLLERMTSFSYLTSDNSSERMSKTPRVLPPMPTLELLNKYKKSNIPPVTVVPSTAFTDSSSELERNIVRELEEDRKEYLSLRLHYRNVMMSHFIEEQKLSNRLMEEAYEGRLKAIERMAR